jgi:hypothetical protein
MDVGQRQKDRRAIRPGGHHEHRRPSPPAQATATGGGSNPRGDP